MHRSPHNRYPRRRRPWPSTPSRARTGSPACTRRRAFKAAAQAGTLHLGSWWDDFWNWLKSAAATVTHVIVAIGEDIYLGIRVIIDGVAHVFRTIIAGIEEVAKAIGSFFMQLGRLIEEVIEALSMLFQFGHIIDTHNILKAELLKRINGMAHRLPGPGHPGRTRSTGSTPATGVIAQVDAFFEQGEQAISDALNRLANALAGSSVTRPPGQRLHRPLNLLGHAQEPAGLHPAMPRRAPGRSTNSTAASGPPAQRPRPRSDACWQATTRSARSSTASPGV